MLEEEPHPSQAFLIIHLFNQNDPNSLVRDFGLTRKNQSFSATKAVKCTYIFVRGISSFRIASQYITVTAIAVISMTYSMNLNMSTILMSGGSLLI